MAWRFKGGRLIYVGPPQQELQGLGEQLRQPHTRPRKGGLKPKTRHERISNYVKQGGSLRLAVMSSDEQVLKSLTGPQKRRTNHKTNHALAPFGDKPKMRTRRRGK